jgi:hypothetical protein
MVCGRREERGNPTSPNNVCNTPLVGLKCERSSHFSPTFWGFAKKRN